MADVRVCSVPDCFNPINCKGMCPSHYNRWRRHGDPNGGGTHSAAPIKFLMTVVENPPDHCVDWPFGRHQKGYGQIRYKGRQMGAHRLALQLYSGESWAGMDAAHRPLICHNTKCVNPRHLYWAEPQQNSLDKVVDGTIARGERHGFSKLTEAKVLAIRADPDFNTRIAKRYGVDRRTIDKIKNREAWSWL